MSVAVAVTERDSVSQYERYFPLIILIFALPLFFYKLGALGFVGPDEPRYAQVAREMYQRGDWITPTLLGDTWFEKPALLYWMMIGFYRLLGVNEWAARLPNALLATTNLLIIYWLAKRVAGSRYGLVSALALATAPLYFGLARAASFDMPLTFTFTAALALFHLGDTTTNSIHRRFYLYGCYFAVGISLIAKGLVGIVLIGAIIGGYIILTGQLRRLFQFYPFTGLLVCLLAASLWYLPVIARHGWPFINEFFVQHHFQRYTSNRYHHPGPIYFFVEIIIAGVAPWSLLLIALTARAAKDLLRAPRAWFSQLKDLAPKQRLLLLAALWVCVPLIFFSFSNSKLPGYILPVFPALALIIGVAVEEILAAPNELRDRALLIVTALLLLAVGLALPYFAGKEFHSNATTKLILASAPIIAAIGLLLAIWQRNAKFAISTLILMSPLLAIAMAALLYPAIEEKASLAPLARVAATAMRANEKLIFFNYAQYSPFFYTNGRVVAGEKGEAARVDNSDELAQYLSDYESLLCIARIGQADLIGNDARFHSELIGQQRDLDLLRVYLRDKPNQQIKNKKAAQ
jgi:4-amino-4-deoxy-L-arabinose transferase-like glycosyltransferase